MSLPNEVTMQLQTDDELQGRAKQLDLALESDPLNGGYTDRAFAIQALRFDLDIMTAEMLAPALKLTEQTLAFWRGNGEGPPFTKAGRNVFYRRRDVMKWLEARTIDPAAGKVHAPMPEAA